MQRVTLWQDDDRIYSDFRVGDARGVLALLPEASVHTVISSPPYWGLRSYAGAQEAIWGGRPDCTHEWSDGKARFRDNRNGKGTDNTLGEGTRFTTNLRDGDATPHGTCIHCGAWHGSLGLEPTPEQYVAHLCEILDLGLRRVLRKDGTLWLNLGDSYAGSGGVAGGNAEQGKQRGVVGSRARWAKGSGKGIGQKRHHPPSGLKPKDLVGIPWQVAFAMRSRGWYLRSALPWVKRNCMPSSVRDRPVTGTETIFLFAHPDSKGRYFYDVEATRAPTSRNPVTAARRNRKDNGAVGTAALFDQAEGQSGTGANRRYRGDTRSRRDTDFFFDSLDAIRERKAQTLLHADDGEATPGTVSEDHPTPLALTVNPRPFKQAHFAVFPPQLVEPMVKAGTSEHGCCAECGAPWKHMVKRPKNPAGIGGGTRREVHRNDGLVVGRPRDYAAEKRIGTVTTSWWEPTCTHDAERVPCTVLDPFGGAGTVALVANQLGRRALYIDTAETYQEMAVSRVEQELAL